MNTEDRLREAIQAGEVLRVIYQGGTQPGALREIAPISLENGKVTARCFTSNAVKSFVVEKIVIVEGEKQPEVKGWQPGVTSSQRYESITELLRKEKGFFTQLGWHIEGNDNHLSLHRRFKNGNPLKGSDVSLDYEEYTYDLVAGLDGEVHEENMRKRQRPWTVRGKNKDTKTYSHLDKAVEVFMEWAKLLAPVVK